jgi:hypothetical protein
MRGFVSFNHSLGSMTREATSKKIETEMNYFPKIDPRWVRKPSSSFFLPPMLSS